MFTNNEKNPIYTVKSYSSIPPNVTKTDRLTWDLLQQLVLLIIKQYGLTNDDVKAEFNRLAPENVHVFLFNGLYGFDEPEVDEINVEPIIFLKTYDGKVAKDDKALGNWSNSMITFKRDNLPNMISDLEYLIAHDIDFNTTLKNVF